MYYYCLDWIARCRPVTCGNILPRTGGNELPLTAAKSCHC
jgi:hypothetical protein